MKVNLIWLLLLLTYSLCHITVLGPSDLVDKAKQWEYSGILNRIGNFGRIPYGKTIFGNVFYHNNTDGFNTWCDYEKTSIPDKWINSKDTSLVPIFLVDHSTDCRYTQKALNVKNRNGGVIWIISKDDSFMDDFNIDDQFGDKVDIPTFIITKKMGDLFKEFYLNKKDTEEITWNIEITGVKKDGTLDIELFFRSDDVKAWSFFTDFYYYYKKLGSKLHFRPYYKYNIYLNEETDNSLDIGSEIPCIKKTHYCVSSNNDLKITNPRIIWLENLRQSCWYSIYGWDVYWAYMTNFYDLCADINNPTFNEECALNVFKHIGIYENRSRIKQCMQDLIDSPSKVESDYNEYNWKQVFKVPEWTINNVKYRGSWFSKYIFNSICSGFIDDEEFCAAPKPETIKNISPVRIIIYVSIFIFAILIILLICYRRIVNRSLEESLSEKIQQQTLMSLGQYNKMTDKSTAEISLSASHSAYSMINYNNTSNINSN